MLYAFFIVRKGIMIIKFIKKKFNLIKICAVFTTVCFVVSTLGANLYAIPLAENANQKYEDVFNKASSISAEYGKITASKDANSDITIINIQDLHCHPQTQRNISKIIAQIAEKYNLKLPICDSLYRILNKEIEPMALLQELMMQGKMASDED